MAFVNTSSSFKPSTFALTELRVQMAMKYIIHCYFEMIANGQKYDYSKIGSLKKEEHLRNVLVDNYLSKSSYKSHYKNSISDSPTVEIYFQKEELQTYADAKSEDYIDISIKETKLSNLLSGVTDDEIRFAVECKRINIKSDCADYIDDIGNFCNRSFSTYRLPFEGQIAFIETSKLDHTNVSLEINRRLKLSATIVTKQFLDNIVIDVKFLGSYSSVHERAVKPQSDFTIFHLLFDYSNMII